MSLCYLYSEEFSYPYVQIMLDSFNNSMSLNIDEHDNIDTFDIYVIELNNANKENSQKLIKLFKNKHAPLIYFIIPKNHTLILFQLTFLLEAKSVITYNQNIDKIIAKIKIDREALSQNNFEKWLGNIKIKTQNFLIFKNNQLVYINKSLLDFFECKDNTLFEETILPNMNTEKLLQSDVTLSMNTLHTSYLQKRYICKSVTVSDNDKIIYVEEDTNTHEEVGFVSSRVAFIELLKENMLQGNISKKDLSALTINISNIKELLLKYSLVEFEEILFDLLKFIESLLDKKLIFSQFENHFYVLLFDDTNFQSMNNIAEHFHAKVLNYIDTKEKKIAIDLFSIFLKDQEFSTVLTHLNKIENEDFILDDTYSQYMKFFTCKDCKITPKKLLDDAYSDKLELKLLNIYHGLVINTPSKIVKVTDENIYITFESLQGVILNLDKQTVLQSENFPQDISADIKQISLTKKVAILENFQFLRTNANSRKYARVTTPIKVPIAINMDRKTITGTILDISIKSIAISVKHTPKIPLVEPNKASLTFNILDKESEDGYIQLNLAAIVTVVTPIDSTNHYKVICDLDQDSHDLDIVLKYVYERQKELIVELKKMSKLN